MSRHPVERTAEMVLGFLAGAALAVCIAPGDVFLWVATGVVLGLFAHAFFVGRFGGDPLWPVTRVRHHDRPGRHGTH